MTQLLISVRTPDEAEVALRAGADLIDIKEPTRGPMGMADPAVIAAIIERVAGRRPVSAALGELKSKADFSALPPGLSFVKIGLARVGKQWRDQLADRFAQVPSAGKVPVLYADLVVDGKCPEPEEVIEWCRQQKAAGILMDTCKKRNGTCLLDFFPPELLAVCAKLAHLSGLFLALAGSLGGPTARTAAMLGADIIGMRGAVCRNRHRNGKLDPLVIRGQQLNLALATARTPQPDQQPADSPPQ